jgi:hypothetical protein
MRIIIICRPNSCANSVKARSSRHAISLTQVCPLNLPAVIQLTRTAGKLCPYRDLCIYGHVCPKGSSCPKKGTCKFKGRECVCCLPIGLSHLYPQRVCTSSGPFKLETLPPLNEFDTILISVFLTLVALSLALCFVPFSWSPRVVYFACSASELLDLFESSEFSRDHMTLTVLNSPLTRKYCT